MQARIRAGLVPRDDFGYSLVVRAEELRLPGLLSLDEVGVGPQPRWLRQVNVLQHSAAAHRYEPGVDREMEHAVFWHAAGARNHMAAPIVHARADVLALNQPVASVGVATGLRFTRSGAGDSSDRFR